MGSKVLGLCLLIIYSVSVQSSENAAEQKAPRQNFGNLQFAIPAFGLLNSRQGGIFGGKSSVTRTVISTVTTVTIPYFKTCTTSMMLMPCAGRRRRDADEPQQDLVEPTPSMKIIIDKTEITDPGKIAEILHLPDPSNLFAPNPNNKQEAGEPDATTTTQPLLERALDETTIIYSSLEDETVPPVSDDGGSNTARSDIDTTDATPSLDDANTEAATTNDPVQLDIDGKARLGVGGGGSSGGTITSTIPVTHVVSSTVTAAMQTLTVSYAGCSPPGPLPISTSVCM